MLVSFIGIITPTIVSFLCGLIFFYLWWSCKTICSINLMYWHHCFLVVACYAENSISLTLKTSTTSCTKIRRDGDVISSFPDEVICHILSFLPTKHAVATSVLSKRWTDLWHSVPVLNFSDVELNDQEACFRFNKFVNSVLLWLNPTKFKSCIIYILCDDDLSHHVYPNIIKLVNHVVQRGVEHLDICTSMLNDDPFIFPINILSCMTLVRLDFYKFIVKDFSTITLPSLKILHFEETDFWNYQDLILLLAGCPNLENLCATFLGFYSENSLTYQELQSLSLNKLSKAKLWRTYGHFPFKVLQNVELLFIEINKVWILLWTWCYLICNFVLGILTLFFTVYLSMLFICLGVEVVMRFLHFTIWQPLHFTL